MKIQCFRDHAAKPDRPAESANLSYHGQEGNIELGVRIKSEKIAKQLDEIFTQLLFSKIFEEVGKEC